MRIIIVISFVIILLASCHNSMQKNEVISKNNGLSITNMQTLPEVESSNLKSIDDVTFKIHKLSEEGIAELYKGRFHDTLTDYKNFTCLYLDVQSDKFPDIVNYPSRNYSNLNDKIQYLSFLIKDDIKIKAGNKEYKCINATFDRTYGQIPYSRFFLVFEKVKGEMVFQFNDYYFNKGLINLKI